MSGNLKKYVIGADFDFTIPNPSIYEDSIWEICLVHDFDGDNLILPRNVTLFFNGGQFINYGVITLNETKFEFASIYPAFDGTGTFKGTNTSSGGPKVVNGFITPIHFGAIGDGVVDSTNAFNKTAQFVGSQKVNFINDGRPSYVYPKELQYTEVKVPSGIYNITDSIILRAGQVWLGNRANTLILFQPNLKSTTDSLSDYRRIKTGEDVFDYTIENTYNTLDEMLSGQDNQSNKLLQFVTDARTAQEVLDNVPVYSYTFQLNLNKDLFVIDGTINPPEFNYGYYVMEHIRFKGFTLTGDVEYDGTGYAGNAIYMNDASQCLFEDIYISKFERGAHVNIGYIKRAAYYNKFNNVHIQYVKQALNIGEATAVTDFENCIFVARAETTERYKHLIETYNNSTFRNCSFEGGTPETECIYAPIGKVTIIGGRDESNSLIKFSGRGVTGGVTVILPNGPAGNSPTRFGSVIDIDDAPLEEDMNLDKNVLGQNINFGQGVAQELKMLKNQNWKLGVLDWSFDGGAQHGFYELINSRENLFGSQNGIKLTKTSGNTNGYVIFQTMKINTPKFYVTVWVKKSSDAILRTQIGILYAKDNSNEMINSDYPYFKEFIKILNVGEWTLYVASVAHYYKISPSNDPRPYLGLGKLSPIGSWVIFSNLRFWAGGYPLFSGSDDYQVNKQYVSSRLPTKGLLQKGDEISYDGTDPEYPLSTTDSKGAICNFHLDTNLSANALVSDTIIELLDVTGVEVGDYVGVFQNTGGISWSKISNVSISESKITLEDGLAGDSNEKNKVYIYRLIPKESLSSNESNTITTAVKTNDETKANNNTIALDTELQILLQANSYYSIEVQLLYEADGAADFRTQFQIPSLAEGNMYFDRSSTARNTYSIDHLLSNAGFGIGSLKVTHFTVLINTNADSGLFGLKWAQNSPNMIGTILKKGSSIKAVKLN